MPGSASWLPGALSGNQPQTRGCWVRIPEQRTVAFRAAQPFRRMTAGSRSVADVVVCGAQKSGTTYLAALMGAQEGFYTPPTKEIHFYSGFWDRGQPWYRAHFERTSTHDLQVDASPSYMIFPEVAVRIRATNPSARLVFLLRDPAERAYSHFQHNVRAGLEHLDFGAALAAESERLAPELVSMAADPTFVGQQFALYGYRTRGEYARFLRAFYAVLPAEQILVLDSAKVFASDVEEFRLLSSFVGREVHPASGRGVRTNAGSYEALDTAALVALRASYASQDQEISELTGRVFAWMGAGVRP